MIIKLIVMCYACTVVGTDYDNLNLIIDRLKKKPKKAAMLGLPTKS